MLSEVDRNPEVSQRDLSHRIGIALGLTNLLIRNLAQKGYIRATQAGWKRWLYNLTPEGFARKVHLTTGYIHRVMDHYHQVRQTLREQLDPLVLNEESRVAIYGTGEFAELVYLGLREVGIEEIEIFSTEVSDGNKFLGMPVLDIASLQPVEYDWILVAQLNGTDTPLIETSKNLAATDKIVTFFSEGRGGEGI